MDWLALRTIGLTLVLSIMLKMVSTLLTGGLKRIILVG